MAAAIPLMRVYAWALSAICGIGLSLMSGPGMVEAAIIDVALAGYDLDYRDVVQGTYEDVSNDTLITVRLRVDDTVSQWQAGHNSGPTYEEDFILTWFGESRITSDYAFPNLPSNPFAGSPTQAHETRLEEYDRVGDPSFQAQAALFTDFLDASDGVESYHAGSSIVGWDWDGGDGVMNVKTSDELLNHLTQLMLEGAPLWFTTESYLRDQAFQYSNYSIYIVNDIRIRSINTPIPEPSSLLLLGTGLLGLAGWRRRFGYRLY